MASLPQVVVFPLTLVVADERLAWQDWLSPRAEALARAVVDLSGRPFCRVQLPPELLYAFVTPAFPVTLLGEFWRGFATRGRLNLHLDVERAVDPHHAVEAAFKAAAIALRLAVALVGGGVPSTKGTLAV